MLLPMILGNLMLLADIIAMLPFRFATYVLCFGWCYSHVALFSLWQMVMLLPSGWCLYWQMLLPFVLWLLVLPLLIISWTKRCTTVVVVIIFLWLMLLSWLLMVLPCIWLADAVVMWLMFSPLVYFLFCWQMLLPGGWCFCQYYVVLFCWQMLLPGGW